MRFRSYAVRHIRQVRSYVIDRCSEASCFLQPMCLVGTSTLEVALPGLGRRLIKIDVDFGPVSETSHSRSDHHLVERPGEGFPSSTVGVVVVAEVPWPNRPNRGASWGLVATFSPAHPSFPAPRWRPTLIVPVYGLGNNLSQQRARLGV